MVHSARKVKIAVKILSLGCSLHKKTFFLKSQYDALLIFLLKSKIWLNIDITINLEKNLLFEAR